MIRTLLTLLPPGSRPTVLTHLGLTLVSVVLRAVGAVLLVPLVAAVIGGQGSPWPWVGTLALVTVTGWLVDRSISRLGAELGFGLLETAQHAVADRIARTRLTWFDADHTATTRQAVAATGPELVGLVIYLVTPLLAAVLLPVAIGVALLPVSWPLGVAALACVPVLLGAWWASRRLSQAADRAAAETSARLTERIVEFGRTQHALRAARRVDPARSHAGAALDSQHRASVRMLVMQIPGQLLFSVATQVALVALAATTVALALSGAVTIPQSIALIVVVVRYLEPFTALAELAPGVETTAGTLRRLQTVLGSPVDPSGHDRPECDRPPRIELRGLGFQYDAADRPVLDGVDLVLQPGSTTALVGPSGSGKSTLLALLAGLYQPSQGSIMVDGVDLIGLDAETRRGLVSVVFQDAFLFDGTIRDNVLVGRPGADDPALLGVAELSGVGSILRRLPDGWETRVGEAGGSLSGGERQRVSIARALLKPAPLLLLDEATSALDTENEAAVIAALTEDPTPRTRVLVTHRLGSIRVADRVVFLEGGRVVEDGTPGDLLAAGGRFADFWREQDAASGWRLGAR